MASLLNVICFYYNRFAEGERSGRNHGPSRQALILAGGYANFQSIIKSVEAL